jgi:hypothetical protein
MPLALALRREQPSCLVHELLLGPLARIGEIAIRVANHPLGTVIVVLDGDVDRHVRSLPHDLSVSRCPGGVNGRWSLLAPAKAVTVSSMRQRGGEQPAQQPDQRNVCPADSAFV